MAELVDAYVSGAYARKGVGVQVPLPAQLRIKLFDALLEPSNKAFLVVDPTDLLQGR